MRVVPFESVEWTGNENKHRGGGLNFKILLQGVEDTPENYWLSIAKGDGTFNSPRHRHNFDQFRMCLQGRANIDPKKYIEPGEVGYFPEGTYYGPQQDTEENTTLVLQFGAASGNGFLSRAQIRQVQSELLSQGEFKNGVYIRTAGEGRKNQDGFEAIWEHATGRKLVYPAPRFESPIYMKYGNFAWRAAAAEGVSKKTLAVFTERETRAEMIKIVAGHTWTSSAEDAIAVMFVTSGTGTCSGVDYRQYTSVETTSGEQADFHAETDTEVLCLVLPMLRALAGTGATENTTSTIAAE